MSTTTPTPIKILLVEDQQLVREGLKGLLALSPELQIVGEAADGAEALAQIPELMPDVVEAQRAVLASLETLLATLVQIAE